MYMLLDYNKDNKKLTIDFSNNPCLSEIDQFFESIESKESKNDCKYKEYLKCMANHILTKMSYEDYVNPKIPENGVTKQNLNNLCKFMFSFF